jgi:hypothetical protein
VRWVVVRKEQGYILGLGMQFGRHQTASTISLRGVNASQVFWRGGGWGPGIGFGIAAGAFTAAALASSPYWGGGYWGAYPGYGGYPGYAYAPAYGYGGYAPAYAYGGYGPAYYGNHLRAPALRLRLRPGRTSRSLR